jgi:DNA-binding CsgD family transcriptional regulator
LGALFESLDRATRGHGSLTLVGGEPGIGKTRLVAELAERARAEGWRVLVGRAVESEDVLPFLPFVETLRGYVRACPLDQLREQLAEGAPEVALLIREVRSRLPELEPSPALRAENERYRLFESISDFLINIASSEPRGLLLVVDDVQWADKPSLLLLQHLARKLGAAPCLVVGTYRSIDLGRASPLADTLAELTRERLAERVGLRPLARDEIGALVEALTGVSPAISLIDAILRQTEGNPFFVEEVVRDLQAEGHDFRSASAVLPMRGVPESIRQVVGKRLGRLSPPAIEALRVAAILGDRFGFGALELASGTREAELVDALDEVVAAGLLREDGGMYRFTHALIQQTVYGELSTPRRARLHRQVGDALERGYAPNVESHLSELAHHFLEAAIVGDRDKAIEYARRAGDRAMESLGYEQAARLYQRALEVDAQRETSDSVGRGSLQLALGDTLRKAGELHLAMTAFEQAWKIGRDHALPEVQARAAIGFEEALAPTGLPRLGLDSPSVVMQQEALRALGDGDTVLRATLLASLTRAVYFAGAREQAADLSDEAISVARRAGDRRVLAYALLSRCLAIWGPEHTEERLAVAADSVKLAQEVGDRELALEGCEWLIRGWFEMGDVAEVDRAIDTYARLADEVRQPRYHADVATWRAIQGLLAGRFAEAEANALQARALAEQIQSRNAHVYFTVLMLALRRDQGRIEDLFALEREFQMLKVQQPTDRAQYAVHAMLHAELGNWEEARRELERFAETGFDGIARDWLMIPTLMFLASACAFLGNVERAEPLYALLRPFARRFNTDAGCLGAVARPLGLLATTMGKWDLAVEHFEDAIALNQRIGALPTVAHTHDAYARMLARRGHRDDVRRAREQAQLARCLYARFDMAYDVARIDAFLAALPECAESPPTYPDGLTAREVEVLQLLADGRSNREIAEKLVLSVRTVERHITNLYAKIDAHGKADATSYALKHGLTLTRGRG